MPKYRLNCGTLVFAILTKGVFMATYGSIQSRQNQTVGKYASLKEKKNRDSLSLFCFEGEKLFLEAISSKAEFECVFTLERQTDFCMKHLENIDCPLYEVNESVYAKLSDEKSPEGIFCVCRIKENQVKKDGITILLDTIQDPGNLGTIMRSAEAFGCKKIICSSGCCDVFSTKTVRASMGSVFRMPVVRNADLLSEIDELENSGVKVYACILDRKAGKLSEIEDFSNTAFIIGNEGNGISEKIRTRCNHYTYIQMMENASESLNASVAASIIMYKAFEKENQNKK